MNIKILCRCSLFPSWRAKDLSAPLYQPFMFIISHTDSSANIVSSLHPGDQDTCFDSWHKDKWCISHPGCTYCFPPILIMTEYWGWRGQGSKLFIPLRLVPRLMKSGVIPPLSRKSFLNCISRVIALIFHIARAVYILQDCGLCEFFSKLKVLISYYNYYIFLVEYKISS